LVEQLQSGDLDLGISGLPVRNPDIVCSELTREPLFLAVAEKHPLAREKSVDLRDLQNERLLLLKEGHCLRDDVLRTCARGRTELHRVFETDQLASIFQFVRLRLRFDRSARHDSVTFRRLQADSAAREQLSPHRISASATARRQPADARIYRLVADTGAARASQRPDYFLWHDLSGDTRSAWSREVA
jgi:DNA-binding transcriptional LysR family regulator